MPLNKPVSSAGPEMGAAVEKEYEMGAAKAGVSHDSSAVHRLADAIFLNDMKSISLIDDDETKIALSRALQCGRQHLRWVVMALG
ncbi:hypothetical protein [Aquabacterium sp.]|uniref:hypothetical protein n=1 Tax=Aquabacterium sp. TaxID=1872578 RepID=UPI0019B1D5AC|nr:hypothetical protein [Aquabacterium sp.]MBC7699261.1 hypothetical protein [Aquabacterium sp.]